MSNKLSKAQKFVISGAILIVLSGVAFDYRQFGLGGTMALVGVMLFIGGPILSSMIDD